MHHDLEQSIGHRPQQPYCLCCNQLDYEVAFAIRAIMLFIGT